MKLCKQINEELNESITHKAGLGVVIKSFSEKLIRLLHDHKLEVINYNVGLMADSLARGEEPKPIKTVKFTKLIDLEESKKIDIKPSSIFKGSDIPDSFRNKFADSFNAYASTIMSADDHLFGSIGKKGYLKHFLMLEIVAKKK